MATYPHPNSAPILALFNYLPQDANGWSILTPSADSRLIYVDEIGGNNGTAVNYTPATLPTANDWENPGAVLAYADITTAMAQTRTGSPDWVLLKRGGEFTFSGTLHPAAGLSLSERQVITAYGAGTVRPHINPIDVDSLLRLWGANVSYHAIVGVKIYPTWCDPDNADWDAVLGFERPDGITMYNGSTGGVGVLIEDCHISSCKHNMRLFSDGSDGVYPHSDVIIRRNLTEYAKGQGIISDSSSLLIEENVFYHNGWWTQSGTGDIDGQATIFDHSIYLPKTKNTLIRNNVTIDPSSIHFKFTANTSGVDSVQVEDVVVHNNFFMGGEIAQSIGGNSDQNTGARWRNIRSTWNCMTELGIQRPTLRRLGWGIDAQDWEGGLVGANLFFRYGDTEVTQVAGIGVMGHCSDVDITSNTIYKIGAPTGTNQNSYQALGTVAQGGFMTNVLMADNLIQLPDTDCMPIGRHEALGGTTFVANKYNSAEVGDWYEYDNVTMGYAEWVTNTGDTSTETVVTFVDETRTAYSYMTTIGETATRQAFIALHRNRVAGTWDVEHEARYLNAYLRAGYTPV